MKGKKEDPTDNSGNLRDSIILICSEEEKPLSIK
jgi:hypothetical protein